jgi:hypothetical protein
MTPDERKMLLDLAAKISQMPPPQRDPEAEEIIRTRIGSRPDALYLMTQTVLIQNLALQRLQQQIQELQNRQSQGQVTTGSSWLGQQQPSYSAPAPAPTPQYAAPSAGFGGAGGFLRGAAQTAAGVAAGTLAAEAIGSMFLHHGGGFFGGNEFAGSGIAPGETIINNYYDSPGPGASEVDYRGDDTTRFADASTSDDAGQYDDASQFDDASLDDAGLDFDDGSNFDTGSDDSLV